VRRVRSRLVSSGVPVGEVLVLRNLALDACNWHPSRADQQEIARKVAMAIEVLMPDWRPSSP
jgi:hypothetical protein